MLKAFSSLSSLSRTMPASPSGASGDQSVRSGVLHVTTDGFLSRWRWKPRFAILTTTKLSFYTFEGGELKLEVNLSECKPADIQVVPVDRVKLTRANGLSIWRVAITVARQRYLIAWSTEYEMNLWVQDLIETAHQRVNPAREMRPSFGLPPGIVEAYSMELVGSKFRSSIRRPPPPRMSNIDLDDFVVA
ncbi:hypothetical protein Ae201684P_008819 [Aphanomyces euteiches]|uniref:PH domain-containing protein n=1 Tax=Aphanomyces euteiches TaxID=100861 RepID=A0A6G0XPR8_9STRA|nr:hypothetical protein Ae201684_002735 [Aphanomyces euteiches]KAH9093159.1 hypothetical protein Ae201684P_008819 [Aphanomyces euteiches]